MSMLSGSGLVGAAVALLGSTAILMGTAVAQEAPTLAELEAAAQAEGGVVNFYSTAADAQPLFDEALKQTYPWMTVNVFGGSPGDVRAKYMTEVQGGLPAADVVVVVLADIKVFRGLDAMASVPLPNDSAMPEDLLIYAPELHPLWSVAYVMPYNTDAGITPPHDPYELIDPKWRGHIALDRPSNAGATGAFLASRRQIWGDEKWEEWLAGLQANEIYITPTANTTYAAILQGEAQLGIGGLQDILTQREGSPVAANFYDQVVVNNNFGIVSKLAPHPASAALFLNWLMSEEAQQLFAQSGRVPARLIDSPMSLDRLLPAGATIIPVASMTDWIDNTSWYLDRYRQLWPE